MTIIYRAFDGKEFDNEADCCYHEHTLYSAYTAWDRTGRQLEVGETTEHAYVVHLHDDHSARAFIEAAKNCGDTSMTGICEGDMGFYRWNEWDERYEWVDEEVYRFVIKIIDSVEKSKSDPVIE
jgi:hypothetical protein